MMIFSYFQRKLTSFSKKDITDEQIQLKQSLHQLQKEIESLKSQLETKSAQQNTNPPEEKKIVIEKLIIETLNIENADLSNNFGNLGIRELQGQLYIGTTYDSLKTKENIEKITKNKTNLLKSDVTSPKINMLQKKSPPKL